MATINVLGAGQMGGIVVDDLLDAGHSVKLFDITNGNDLSDEKQRFKACRNTDLIVCALPSFLGKLVIKDAIEAGVDCVDLSFSNADMYDLEVAAKRSGVVVLHDCGFCPGLSNLVAGLYPTAQKLDIYVGGVAQDSSKPFGYVQTWSLHDLAQEYTRRARWKEHGKVTASDPLDLSMLESKFIDGVGRFEAFRSDGLRSLLDMRVPDMVEYTLRWPGHIREIAKVIEENEGKIPEDTFEKGGLDMATMLVEVNGHEAFKLLCYGTQEETAMAMCTAYACSAFAQSLLLPRLRPDPGVYAPEQLPRYNAISPTYMFIRQYLAAKGVTLWREGIKVSG